VNEAVDSTDEGEPLEFDRFDLFMADPPIAALICQQHHVWNR
jgi:hypothetical protein